MNAGELRQYISTAGNNDRVEFTLSVEGHESDLEHPSSPANYFCLPVYATGSSGQHGGRYYISLACDETVLRSLADVCDIDAEVALNALELILDWAQRERRLKNRPGRSIDAKEVFE